MKFAFESSRLICNPGQRYQCSDEHCESVANHCSKWRCSEYLYGFRLTSPDVSGRNAKIRAFNSAKEYAKMLEDEIHETCDISKLARLSTKLASLEVPSDGIRVFSWNDACSCLYSHLLPEAKYMAALDEAKQAVDRCYSELKEYRSTHDLQAEAPSKNNKAKQFTRTGTYRGHGASAMKPKLNMQNSYEVASLTTNSMMGRPIKTAPVKRSSASKADKN